MFAGTGRVDANAWTRRHVLLFLAAGGLNTCFGYAAFVVFLWLGNSKEVAVVLGTAAGIAFNFQTYGAVFSRSGFGRLPHFVALYLVLLGANILLLRLLTASRLSPYAGQAIIVVLSTPISFVAMRTVVFPAADEARP
jgi:putative flippase GtrA